MHDTPPSKIDLGWPGRVGTRMQVICADEVNGRKKLRHHKQREREREKRAGKKDRQTCCPVSIDGISTSIQMCDSTTPDRQQTTGTVCVYSGVCLCGRSGIMA